MKRICLFLPALMATLGFGAQTRPGAAELPDAPGRETVKKVCGACHPAQVVLAKGMSREQWGGIVSNMIGRGAKGTDEEFAEIVDYLSKNLPPSANGPAGTATTKKKSGGLLDQAGASDKQVVDEEAATNIVNKSM